MKADTKTLLKLFGADVQYEIPMFQRPYVWEAGQAVGSALDGSRLCV